MSGSENPYASPIEVSTRPPASGRNSIRPFSLANVSGFVCVALLGISALLNFASLGSNWSQYQLLLRDQRGQPITEQEAISNYVRQLWLTRLEFGSYLVAAVSFCVWVYRAHRNLPALGSTYLEFSHTGAFGWYFCPFLCYFKPYLATREIATGSDPDRGNPGDATFRRGRNLPILPWWWAGFVAMNAIGIVLFHAGRIDTESLTIFTQLSMVDNLVTAVTGILACVVVVGINRRQQESYAMILTQPEIVVPASQPQAEVNEFLDSLQ
jgi:uncharacterized protein DUF4328